MKRLAIIVGSHGRGSNMLALADRCESDQEIKIATVIAPRADSPAALAAQDRGLNVEVIPYGENFTQGLLEALRDIDWICLAGFMKLFPLEILAAHQNRVLNIHPALLPNFGGKGMYGIHVHKAVIEARETESGCTVHYVSPKYDEGATILQSRCPVLPDDTPESLAARVLALEHETYYRALKLAIKRADEK